MATLSRTPIDTQAELRSSNYFDHWPPYVFYFPVIVCYLLLSCRHKSLTLPSVANPEFPESKCDSLDLIPDALARWVGRYQRFHSNEEPAQRADAAQKCINDAGLTYPLVIKPDLGLKGIGVAQLDDKQALDNYLQRHEGAGDFQFQEYIDWPGEAGAFYIRMPGKAKGRIVSLAFKFPASVTGDGRSPLKALIEVKEIPRTKKKLFLSHNRHRLEQVIKKGKTFPLMFVRNHDQGGVYRNGRAWITTELNNRFDEIARAIPNFYYGRFDVKFETMDTFAKGQQFKIIEINGASSEAGHIFDANARLGRVYLSYFKRLNRLFAISIANCRRGYRPVSLKTAIANQRDVFEFVNKGLYGKKDT